MKTSHDGYPNEVSDMVYAYFLERQARSFPYASKFAARSLARRFSVPESDMTGAIEYLEEANLITIQRTTNTLRAYVAKQIKT